MKGLKKIPDTKDLLYAYNAIQSEASLPPEDLSLFSQWVRFDPRLGELLVGYIASKWEELHPITLANELKKQPWPQAMGVVFEHATSLLTSRHNRRDFRAWADCVMHDFSPANGEQFYIGLYTFAGSTVYKLPEQSLRPYTKWGYLEKDPMLGKQKKLLPFRREERLSILKSFMKRQSSVDVSEYLKLIQNQIGRRQAERDLRECPWLRPRGHTKGRRYYFKDYCSM